MGRKTLADVTGQTAPSSSLLAAPWPYLLTGAIILAVGVWSMLGGSAEVNQSGAARDQARQSATQIARVVQEIREMLRAEPIQHLAVGVAEGTARQPVLLTEMRQLIPEVTDVHIYGPEVFMTDLDTMGENGFIMLDMMAVAMEDELSPVQLIDDQGLSYLASASTVGRAVQEKGFLVVYLDPSVLLDLFNVANPAAGYIALEHAAGANAPRKLREVGAGIPAGFIAERFPVDGSLLQVVFPTSSGGGLIGQREQWVLVALGVLLLLLGIARRQMMQRQRPAQETMPEHFETLRDGDLPADTMPPTLKDARMRRTLAPPKEGPDSPGDGTATQPPTLSPTGGGALGASLPEEPPPSLRPPGGRKRAKPRTTETLGETDMTESDKPGLGDRASNPSSLEPPLVGRISQPAVDVGDELPPLDSAFSGTDTAPTDPPSAAEPQGISTSEGEAASEPSAELAPSPEPAAPSADVTERASTPSTGASAAAAPAPAPAGSRSSVPGVELKSHIFRAYDIRGVVGESLDHGIAYQIGQAVGSLAQDSLATPVAVGRDGRHSGPDLVDGLISGLKDSGCPVIDVGAVPTGVLYYAANEMAKGSGVMVTGSHNPPDYNGFKIMIGGRTLAGDDIFDLFERIRTGNLHHGQAEVVQQDALEAYRERIAGDIKLDRPLKIVADCGNGIGAVCAVEVLQAIGAEVVGLYDEVDGDFPNHHPDPSEPENLEDLIESVKLTQADLGVAFDGDADRLGVVTAEGDIVFSDRIMMLYAREVLSRKPGSTIIYDVKCTGHLDTVIREAGGVPEMYKTGHSLMKNRMKDVGAPLAGEMSGHFFFEDRWYGFDCGIYSACRLLEILAAEKDTPTEVLAALPNSVSTPELKVHLEEGENHAFIEDFKQRARFPGARINIIDGVRADFADGWGLVRASNTTPILVLRFDADSEEALKNVQEAFRAQLLAVRGDLKLPF
ncbi:MAG: hypothetical protein AAGH19_05885 [Pseudomonadota bacterium]